MGCIGFIGFMGFIWFVGLLGIVVFVGFIGTCLIVGFIGFRGFMGFTGFLGFRVIGFKCNVNVITHKLKHFAGSSIEASRSITMAGIGISSGHRCLAG